MPITVKHSPNQVLLGRAGLLAGYGDFQKWQVDESQQESQLALQRQAQAEAARRTNAGIFQDQQALAARMYENQAQRQFAAGREIFEAQQAGQLQQRQFGQQQLMQQQQAKSQVELVEQRAQDEYDQAVAKASQEFDWEPWQQRENAKFDQGRIGIENNSRWDEGQKADAMQQLMQQRRRTIGVPRKKKENTVTFRSAVDANGQPIFDAGGNPVRVFDNGTRGEIYQDPTLQEESKMRLEREKAEVKAEFEREKAELKKESDRVKMEADALKAQIKLVQDATEALTTKEKIMGPADPVTGKAEAIGEKVIPPSEEQITAHINMVRRLGAAAGVAVSPALRQATAAAAPQAWQGADQPGRRDFPGDVSEPQQQQAQPQQAPSRQFFSPRLKRAITEQEVMETAQKHGISPEEVLKRLGV